MRQLRVQGSATKNYKLSLDNFSGGTNTVISEARLGKKESNSKYAIESVNLQQSQDGIWETRPGTAYFGTTPSSGNVIDGATEFVKSDGTREIICISGGYCWKSSDDGATWSQVSGATFTTGYRPYFIQYKGVLLISNRQDALASYNGTSLSPYSALSDPGSAPTPTRGAGLSTGSYTHYYRISANNLVGYTNPSASGTITTDKSRSEWVSASSEYIDLSWSSVSGATSYDIWYGQNDGEEVYLGSTSDTVFRDIGQDINPYVEAPDDNTTAAPKFGPMELSGNRLWATYDPDNPWRVYGSGTGQYLGYFSPFYGGFWIDLEKGGRYRPVSVVHYRTGKGDPIVTVLCNSPDGRGTIFQIELSSLTIGDTTFTVPIAYKLVGSTGADAPASVTKFGDNVGFLNKKGAFFLRSKEQLFNILSTDDMTAPFRDQYESLSQSSVADFIGYYKPPRLYFSVATGSNNDRTFFYDLERNNWVWSWNTGYKLLFEYTDTNNTTRFLGVSTTADKLVEISTNYTSDFGSGFSQSYVSPLIPIDASDHTTRAKVRDVLFELGELKGSVNVSVLGKQKNKEVTSLASETVSPNTGNTGWGDDAFSDIQYSDTSNNPTTFASSSQKQRVRVNKKIYAIQFKVSTSQANTYFQLLSIQAKGFVLPGRPPSGWN